MSIFDLLNKLKHLSINLKYVDGHLKVSAPKGTLTDDLIKEINSNKSEVIEILREVEQKDRYITIKPLEEKEYYALSSAQKRLYILHRLEFKSTGYNMPGVISLHEGPEMAVDRLERTFAQLIQRHESFRTSFEMINEEPVQRIHGNVDFVLEYYKLDNCEPPEIEKITGDFVRPFDLSKAPLFRAGLITTGEKDILLVDMHHIVSDGVSHQVLKEEFIKISNGEDLPGLRLQYKDYAEWQGSPGQQQKIKKQEAYWLNTLCAELPVLNLPADYARPAVQSYEGDAINFELNENQTGKVKNILNRTDTTMYMVLLAIYTILLSKWSGQDDIIVGMPIAARRHFDLERIIGMFVNTLAMRNFPSGHKTFHQFLQEVKERTLDAHENQEYQFEDLVDNLAIQRDTSRNPIFSVVFNLFDQRERKSHFNPMDENNRYSYRSKSTKFDLILRAVDYDDRLFFNFEYSTRLFKRKTMERVAEYFKHITGCITANPDITISDIEMIPGDKKREKLNYFNEDLKESAAPKPIQVKLKESFQEYRQNTAVEYGAARVTYGELERKALWISRWILDGKIEKGRLLGIYMEDKVDIIAAIIGILYAGCVFVPLDTRLPVKRIEAMIRMANIQVIFTDAANRTALSHIRANNPIIENIWTVEDSFYKREKSKLSPVKTPGQAIRYDTEDNVYVYFTSGTTGTPHAIVGKNKSLVHFIEWEKTTFSVDQTYRISQLASVGFDAFLRNVFTPLFAGAAVCIPEDPNLVLDSEGLGAWIEASKITLIHCVPGVFRLINSNALTPGKFSRLKYILMSGEQINPNLLKKWHKVFGDRIQLVNCYGATETTIIRTFHFIRESDIRMSRIPAGVPIDNTRVIILDRNMNICPQGIVGEIYIRTPFRSRGYLNNPGLTAERFIKNPFSLDETGILYKTGDLGRELENGDLEILERVDRQVKIRGVRIESQDIENAVMKHEGVDQAVVITRKGENDENHLCAYIVKKEEESIMERGTAPVKGYAYGRGLNALINSDDGKNELLFFFDFAADDYSKNEAVVESFNEQVRKTPDHIVMVWENEHLTYRGLSNQVNCFTLLLKNSGFTRYGKVGILLDHPLQMVIAVLAVARAGGEFFLMDPRLSAEAVVSRMNRDRAAILITDNNTVKEKPFALLQALEQGNAPLTITSPRKPIADLDRLPIPDRSLADYETYTQYIGQSLVKNSISMLGSRGCPYNCKYCHKIWPRNHISRSAENIFAEMLRYYHIGFRRFVFLDDIFNLDVRNTRRLFEMIIQRGLDLQLCLNLRGDILTKEYIDLMVKAGVIRIAAALETASPRLQRMIGKNLNLEKFKANMEYICGNYPQVILEINTMHGFPTETREEARTTLDFIKSLKWVHFPYVNILKIYPHTDMEQFALAHGISQKAINKSASLAYHELPDTLPFEKTFTMKYQLEFMSDYFLSKERLSHVLPYQLQVLSEDEIVQKYNSYLPVDIRSIDDLLKFTDISKEDLNGGLLRRPDPFAIPGLNEKLRRIFPSAIPCKDTVKILLLDLSQFFSAESSRILYDVVEAPLGLMYLAAYLEKQYNENVQVKIAKSRIDFNRFAELKILLEEFQPHVIGIRTLTYFKDFFHQTAAMIRQWGIDVPIAAGGPYATSDFKTILQDRRVNVVVLGEGEETFSQLVGEIIAHQGKLPDEKKLKQIQGIAFVSGEDKSGLISANQVLLLDTLDTGAVFAGNSPGGLKIDDYAASLLFQPAAHPLPPTSFASELRGFLSKELPGYMIPSFFIPIKRIPLTANGKIDRRALPGPKIKTEADSRRPINKIEKQLIKIWAEVLKVNEADLGMDANFFEMGGHSLNATILTSKIHKELQVKVPLTEIFKNQTLSRLSQYIIKSRQDTYMSIEPIEKKDYYELSSPQKRLYILQQMEPGSTAYNMAGTLYLDKGFDRGKLEKAFMELIRRHESLRTSFMMIEEKPFQRIHDTVEFEIEYFSAKCKAQSAERIIQNFVRPFDLSKAPLLRVGLVMTQANPILLVDMHHIISDAASQETLIREFNNIYIYNGEELPELRLQYKDYTGWQNNEEQEAVIKKQEGYWLEIFSGELPTLYLPTDFARAAGLDNEGAAVPFELNEQDTSCLKALAAENDVTLFMTLLAVFDIFLAKLSDQEDIIIGTPVEGRRHMDLRPIIGMFVNTLALRNHPQKEKTFLEFLREVKTQTLQAFENQEYPFDHLVDKVSTGREQGRNPIFDVVFSVSNNPGSHHVPGYPEQKPFKYSGNTSKFDLVLYGYDFGKKLAFTIEYNKKLFKEQSVHRFATYFKEIVAYLVKDRNIGLGDIHIATDLIECGTDIKKEDFMQFDF